MRGPHDLQIAPPDDDGDLRQPRSRQIGRQLRQAFLEAIPLLLDFGIRLAAAQALGRFEEPPAG